MHTRERDQKKKKKKTKEKKNVRYKLKKNSSSFFLLCLCLRASPPPSLLQAKKEEGTEKKKREREQPAVPLLAVRQPCFVSVKNDERERKERKIENLTLSPSLFTSFLSRRTDYIVSFSTSFFLSKRGK